MYSGLSKTGRKIRKDSFEYNHDMDKVESILRVLYLEKRLSTNNIPESMLKDYGIKISALKAYYLIKDLGILRDQSESISIAMSTLDYQKTFLTDEMIDIVDGIVMGDGTIKANHNTGVARLSISGVHKEFIDYCRKFIIEYAPCVTIYSKNIRENPKGKGTWSITTKHHPDLYKIHSRWYRDGKKIIPPDIHFSKMMLLLWYLGDGSLTLHDAGNSRGLTFSTNCFKREEIEGILVPKFKDIGIDVSSVTKENRVSIKTSSIVKLLDIMGGDSPVDCYSYKFDIEEWRKKKTMHDVSNELNFPYYKLSHWVTSGYIKHSRSPGGKKVVFSDDEFEELKRRIESGELPREKGKRNKRIYIANNDIITSKMTRLPDEDEDKFYERVVNEYYRYGFPYKYWNKEKLFKEWHGLKKSQYIIPESEDIKPRNEGLNFPDYFHPHIFEANRQYKISPKELFLNREEFKAALRKCVGMGGILTFSGVLGAIARSSKANRVNNFSPLIARDIYNYYCRDGFRVLDPCAGYSGRLLGASFCKNDIEYIGIDPCIKTYNGLVETKKFINETNPEFKCNIINDCAETYLDLMADSSIDFCFTSPPYFNLEHYSDEKTQSYIKYSNYDEWVEKFLKKMMLGVYRVLKTGGIAAINIGKCGNYDIPSDLVKIGKDIGFSIDCIKNLCFNKYKFVDSDEEFRKEPLILFKK